MTTWNRDGDAWVSGEWRAEAVSESAAGKTTGWGLKRSGAWVTTTLRGQTRTRVFDRLGDAKRYAAEKDAPPEAKAADTAKTCPHSHETHSRLTSCWRKPSVPHAAPSPLEVVRRFIRNDGGFKAPTWKEAEAALATLEESIRADERAACAKVARDRAAHHAEMQRRMESDVMRRAQGAASEACSDVAEFIQRRGR